MGGNAPRPPGGELRNVMALVNSVAATPHPGAGSGGAPRGAAAPGGGGCDKAYRLLARAAGKP
jgi:hypothetical protein